MSGSLLFERDILYTTDNILNPGILHVRVLHPNNSKMPVLIEPKSSHSAVENISSILDVLQKEVFDRINIKVYENTSVYIMQNELDKANNGESKYLNVIFKGIQEFTLEPSDESFEF